MTIIYLLTEEERSKYPFFRKAVFEYKKPTLTTGIIRIAYKNASVLAAYELTHITEKSYHPYNFIIYYIKSYDKTARHVPHEAVHPISLIPLNPFMRSDYYNSLY